MRVLGAWFGSVSIALALVGCGASSEGPDSKTQSAESAEPPPEEPTGTSLREKGKKKSGWRWKGRADDCFFKHDNACYATFEKACKAAKCGDAECVKNDGAPAKVTCAK